MFISPNLVPSNLLWYHSAFWGRCGGDGYAVIQRIQLRNSPLLNRIGWVAIGASIVPGWLLLRNILFCLGVCAAGCWPEFLIRVSHSTLWLSQNISIHYGPLGVGCTPWWTTGEYLQSRCAHILSGPWGSRGRNFLRWSRKICPPGGIIHYWGSTLSVLATQWGFLHPPGIWCDFLQ